MKHWFAGLVAGMLVAPALAQDEGPPPRPLPAPVPSVEDCKHTYQLHWLEREVPGVQTKLREVPTSGTKSSLELKFVPEKRQRTEWVLKPCVVVKEVTLHVQKPVVKVDPYAGCSTVVFEPVTETQRVPVVTYELVPQEKVVTVAVPCLKPSEVPVVRKTFVLESEPVMRKERFGVLAPVEVHERRPLCAAPGCVAPGGPVPPGGRESQDNH